MKKSGWFAISTTLLLFLIIFFGLFRFAYVIQSPNVEQTEIKGTVTRVSNDAIMVEDQAINVNSQSSPVCMVLEVGDEVKIEATRSNEKIVAEKCELLK